MYIYPFVLQYLHKTHHYRVHIHKPHSEWLPIVIYLALLVVVLRHLELVLEVVVLLAEAADQPRFLMTDVVELLAMTRMMLCSPQAYK